jgi:hypothetical protein
MRAKGFTPRKLAAVFLAAILALAVAPAAFAAPSHSMAMQMTDCASHEVTGCDHSMPKQDRSMPCKDMANCLGMTSCVALVAVPHAAVAVQPLASTISQIWHVNTSGSGITHQPDTPPPIV